jgi:phosphoenolpyruvate-protein phosphotransferase
MESLDAVRRDLEEAAGKASGDARDILRAQAAMAADPALRAAAATAIAGGTPAARALLDSGAEFAERLSATNNAYLAARAPDVHHICELAARALIGAPPALPPRPEAVCILVAEDLMPLDTAQLDPALVAGIATAGGTPTSHTSIVARALGIPAVVGVRGLLEEVTDGLALGIDGGAGIVHVEPDDVTVARLRTSALEQQASHERARVRAGTGPTTTADGTRVEVAANIRGIEELRIALAEDAEGVGLLRTELLFVDRHTPPTVEEQAALLRAMRALLGNRRLVVRTFDIGSDKTVPFLPVRPERNPELGVRGVRLAQVHPDLLDAQLEAIAEVVHLGPMAVMAPMVASVEEVDWFVERVAKAGAPPELEVGVMVEVPSAVLMADEIAERVDFVSIGTNDLGQYLHAAERRNPALAGLQDPFDPATLRAVDLVCRGAQGRCWVGVCGEAAADPGWACLAVGSGVTELSMQARSIPEVRAILRRATLADCAAASESARRATDAPTARAIAAELVASVEGRQ